MKPIGFGVAFDLDDTLYLERDYVRSGFRAVADRASVGTAVDPDDAFGFLWNAFLAGVRGSSFDALLARYPALAGAHTVADLISYYREHQPTIDYLPGAEALLQTLKAQGVKLAVISDGPLVSQAAKAAALGVSRYAAPVILTDAWGSDYWKPHKRAFEVVAEAFGLPPERLVYVGDNPAKDFHAPAELGWASVRLRLPEQVRYSASHELLAPTYEVTTVADLQKLLSACARSFLPLQSEL